MGIITAVVTEDARKYFPQYLGGQLNRGFYSFSSFKVGEGGWIDTGGGGKAPRAPNASLRQLATPFIQDLDAVVDVSRIAAAITPRYSADSRAVFEKALLPGDIAFVSPSTARIRCFIDLAEFNNDGFSNSPEIWEIGVFGPLQGGAVAAISTVDVPTANDAVVTGLTGMVASDVGGTLTLLNSTNSVNNGTFPIVAFISATSVRITNAPAIVDAGPLDWAVSTRKLMIAYGTFPEVIKTAGRQDESLVEISF